MSTQLLLAAFLAACRYSYLMGCLVLQAWHADRQTHRRRSFAAAQVSWHTITLSFVASAGGRLAAWSSQGGPVCQVARSAPAQAFSRGALVLCCSDRSPEGQLDPALQQWLAETQGTFSSVLQELQAWHQHRGEPAPLPTLLHPPTDKPLFPMPQCARLGSWSEHFQGTNMLL